MKTRALIGSITVGIAIAGCATVSAQPPFGGSEDVDYAKKLWSALEQEQLVGENRTMSAPYEGTDPHGTMLDTLDREITVEGTSGPVIVKNNYVGENLSRDEVWNNPEKYLGAVTVMFQRDGYDPENNNWFWAKYLPDGSLDTNPKGRELAGKVGKGMDQGCIACHSDAPGDDLVFSFDRY